jgi:predicted class III extradiol MEMO1 family dioxygenase
MPSASWWKSFYSKERESFAERTLMQMVAEGQAISLPPNDAIIFPHTRLSASGHLTAATARAVIESGCDSVLALGVLHMGEQRADKSLRGIHGPGAPQGKDIWRDEFSLDHFKAMLEIAASTAGKRIPKLIERYPFLTGEQPETMPGFDELMILVEHGATIVATADMIHHGVGYGTPAGSRLDRENPETHLWAKREIEAQLSALARKDFAGFLSHCETARSDFRDAGPVLASLLPSSMQHSVLDLRLVNYCDVLNAEEPTWVAAALAKFGQADARPMLLS